MLLTLTTTQNLFSQRDCHTMDHLHDMQEKNPTIYQNMQRIEDHTQSFERSPLLRSEKTIIIPVVFHVLFNTTSEKIAEEVLQSQIDVLNEDFQRLNADQTNQWSQAANVNIEFRLATVAPDKSATNGMLHKFTNKSFFQANDDMMFESRGGSNAWPTDQYLNIWVCDLFGNKIGYAQLPGGGAFETDGVVLDYLAVGRTYNSSKFGLGRTGTHEVGHWLNLRHIWGDGDCDRDDFVADTPRSDFPTFGCQPDKVSCGSLDMTGNFMDYSNDQCMNLFTEGQKARMRALFSSGGFRASILRSSGLGQVDEEPENIPREEACPNDQNCDEDKPAPEPENACASPTQLKASFDNRQFNISWEGTADAYTFELQLPNSTRWYAFSTQRNQLSISGVTKAMVGAARLRADCGDGVTSGYVYFGTDNNRLTQASVELGLLAYPNPVDRELFLQWSKPDIYFNGTQFESAETIRSAFIELYDRSGRMVLRQVTDKDQYNTILQVFDLPAGLYFIMQRGQNGQLLGSLKIQISKAKFK